MVVDWYATSPHLHLLHYTEQLLGMQHFTMSTCLEAGEELGMQHSITPRGLEAGDILGMQHSITFTCLEAGVLMVMKKLYKAYPSLSSSKVIIGRAATFLHVYTVHTPV